MVDDQKLVEFVSDAITEVLRDRVVGQIWPENGEARVREIVHKQADRHGLTAKEKPERYLGDR